MAIEKEKFRSYTLDEDKQKEKLRVISLKLNADDLKLISAAKEIIEQPKDGTCIKTLMRLGYISITKPENKLLLETLFKNKQRNKRIGIVEYEQK